MTISKVVASNNMTARGPPLGAVVTGSPSSGGKVAWMNTIGETILSAGSDLISILYRIQDLFAQIGKASMSLKTLLPPKETGRPSLGAYPPS